MIEDSFASGMALLTLAGIGLGVCRFDCAEALCRATAFTFPLVVSESAFLAAGAFATFFATRSPSIFDPYFMSTVQNVYRILWDPRSRSNQYPMIVFVAPFVTQEQRDIFAAGGAIVRELDLVLFVAMRAHWLLRFLIRIDTCGLHLLLLLALVVSFDGAVDEHCGKVFEVRFDL